MNTVTQFLLLLSYAVLGMAAALFLPFTGMADTSANLLGVLIFVGAWQVQVSFFVNKKNPMDEIDMHRINEIEKLVLKVRDDVGGLQDLLSEQTQRGDQKDKKLVSELKVLQEYLLAVMQKESKGGKIAAKATSRPAPSLVPSVEGKKADTPNPKDQFTAADLEELGLTPEEAAMAVIDESNDAVDPPAQQNTSRRIPSSDAADQPAQPPTAETTSGGIAATPKATALAVNKKAPSKPATKDEDKPTPRTPPTRKKAPIRLIKREDQLLSVVKNSLSENRVDLYLQPIVSLPARRTEHFECFSRVRDEEGRIVLPRQYMKVAETKGLIGTIDNLLLFRLIQLIRRLGKRKPKVKFFCNMSRYSMSDSQFFPQFVDFMSSNLEFAERLVFEISQEDYLTLDGDVLDRLSALGRKGFGFSMDMVTDFNQDFIYLGEQNFRFIKANLNDIVATSTEPGDIDETRLFLLRNGMQLITSRIENEDMVITALDNQIELAQGYLFGEPLAANDMNDDL